jgi:hypothetical protein
MGIVLKNPKIYGNLGKITPHNLGIAKNRVDLLKKI